MIILTLPSRISCNIRQARLTTSSSPSTLAAVLASITVDIKCKSANIKIVLIDPLSSTLHSYYISD